MTFEWHRERRVSGRLHPPECSEIPPAFRVPPAPRSGPAPTRTRIPCGLSDTRLLTPLPTPRPFLSPLSGFIMHMDPFTSTRDRHVGLAERHFSEATC